MHVPRSPRFGKSPTNGGRRWLAVFAAACVAATLTGSATTPVAAETQSAPAVIPALTDWTPADGTYRFGKHSRILVPSHEPSLTQTARTLAGELETRFGGSVPVVHSTRAARDGDVVLRIAHGRDNLGAEGYEMTVGDAVRIEASAGDGAFYGTRTLLQMLTMDRKAPKGRTVDEPRYRERGLGMGLFRYSMPRLERLLKEMAYLKLNYLLLEVPIQSKSHPEAVRWPYYTKEEVKRLVALADKYHVTLIPEVNGPGHMDAYLFDRPDLQLVDKNGEKSPYHLDITNPDAFDFYTDLIDEWSKAFDSPYWHMGADEYMWGTSFENYPSIGEYAKKKFGPDAVPVDAVLDFINRVDDYVNSKGMKLRIWNDGIPAESTVSLHSDIIIEHWEANEVKPSDHIDAGHTVLNAASALYHNRTGRRVSPTSLCGDKPVGETTLERCVARLWEHGWDPGTFEDEKIDPSNPAIRGAKLSLWPGSAQTETQVQRDIFMPLRFIAQRTWGSAEPFIGYERFTARAESLGHAPGWRNVDYRPISDGVYTIRSASGGGVAATGHEPGSALSANTGAGRWQLQHTNDGYYRIVSAESGLCVDMRRGRHVLGAPMEPGAEPTVEVCDGSTTQKWAITRDGNGRAFTITNATSQMVLDLADDGDATVVQMPPDRAGDAAWQLSVEARATIDVELPKGGLTPGYASTVAASFTNTSAKAATGLDLSLKADDGWRVQPASGVSFDRVPPGESVTADWSVTPPDDLPTGFHDLALIATYKAAGDDERLSQTVQVHTAPPGQIPQARLSVYDFDSEEKPTNGYAANAIDGDPLLPWHTAWSQTDPDPDYPHFIALDLGGEYRVDGLKYLPKQRGNKNGWVKGYTVSVSQDGQTWREVTSGEFADTRSATRVDFQPVRARYVKLTGTSSINGGPWMAVAELNVFGAPVG